MPTHWPFFSAFQDKRWLNNSFDQQIFTECCLNARHYARHQEKILTQEDEENKDKNHAYLYSPSLPFLFLFHPLSFFPLSPSTCLSFIWHHWHTKGVVLKPNLYNSSSFQVGILYFLRSSGERFLTAQGKSSPYYRKHYISQGHSVTEYTITTSSFSNHCFITNDASDPFVIPNYCGDTQLLNCPHFITAPGSWSNPVYPNPNLQTVTHSDWIPASLNSPQNRSSMEEPKP